jgi:uncharacterized damage-inducible protein DinB
MDTYETERLKVLSVWGMFENDDLAFRPGENPKGRSVLEQMVHQCLSENLWFQKFFGVDIGTPPLPEPEARMEFIRRYGADSKRRFDALREKDVTWWEEEVAFFETRRSRAWVMVRRIAHTAHHRGQQTAMLRMLGRTVHSTYGPTADTGGLMKDGAPTIYVYSDARALLGDAITGVKKTSLPPPSDHPTTERPSPQQ